MENVVDTAWKGVRVFESSHSESSDSSSHGFNYDSVYLVELQNLPRSATRKEIKDFFPGISILNGLYGIHFILDEKYRKYGRAFVQLEHLREYQSIKKFNQNHLDGRCIDGNKLQHNPPLSNKHMFQINLFQSLWVTTANSKKW